LFSLGLIFRPFFFGGWLLLLIVLLMAVSLGMRLYMFSRQRRHFGVGGGGMRRGPEQILARRFALGEIDEAEYQRRLAALRNPEAPTK
jgi:putative membrane protein